MQQGEQALTPQEIQEAAPQLSTGRGQKAVGLLLSRTQKVAPSLDAMLKMVTMQTGLDPNQDFESRLKNPETIVKKVANHVLKGNKDYKLNDVNDAYGARIIADTPEQKKDAIQAIRDLGENNQIKILKQQQVTKDTYHAYHIDFEKDGVKGEIQIHDPHSLFESVVNHEIRANYGEKPKGQLGQIKQQNAQLAYQLPANQAQSMAQAMQIMKQGAQR